MVFCLRTATRVLNTVPVSLSAEAEPYATSTATGKGQTGPNT
jgi:hypothetical protein